MKLKTRIRRLVYKSREEELISDIKLQKKYYETKNKFHNKFISIFLNIRLAKLHDKILYKYGCDITPEAIIGIVIGGGAIIEDDVIIHQNVTFGALKFDIKERRGVPCHQIVKKGTIICTGAKILGNVVIGENCIVGANAVVTKDVPNGATVVGFNKIILK